MTVFRPESPKVYGAGSEKQAVLNHSTAVAGQLLGSQEMLGRWAGPAPMLARSVPRIGVNGEPDCRVTIPFSRHPVPVIEARQRPLGGEVVHILGHVALGDSRPRIRGIVDRF